MLIISRLRLQNWRNFEEVDIRLRERVFIVGANASGKSNLLDAIRFLRDLARNGGGLIPATRSRGGLSKVRCLAARRKPHVMLEVEISESASATDEWVEKWTYHLAFNQTGGGIRQTKPIIQAERITAAGDELLNTTPGQSHTSIEQPGMLKNGLLELREFLSSITYQHLVPQLLRYPHLFLDANQGEDHFGRAFLESINRINKNTRASHLKKIQEVLGKFIPMLDELTLGKDTQGQPHLQTRYRHWRSRGDFQHEDQFSDGTLRLIGFMWSILDGSHPLLLEEPELSLHPALVRALPEAIAKLQKRQDGKRQVILTTHSPDMLSNRGIALEEIVLLKTGESTQAKLASNVKEARDLLEVDATPAEIVEQQLDAPQSSSIF